MTIPIFDPTFWRERLERARERNQEHQALFLTSFEVWETTEKRHRAILKELIQPTDSILDVGCGWGRLLSLLPAIKGIGTPTPDYGWYGSYFGVDISPDFIALAKQRYPGERFAVGDLRCLYTSVPTLPIKRYDWAVAIAMREMIIGAAGEKVWELIQTNLLHHHCKKLLLLTYDPSDKPEIIPSPFEQAGE